MIFLAEPCSSLRTPPVMPKLRLAWQSSNRELSFDTQHAYIGITISVKSGGVTDREIAPGLDTIAHKARIQRMSPG